MNQFEILSLKLTLLNIRIKNYRIICANFEINYPYQYFKMKFMRIWKCDKKNEMKHIKIWHIPIFNNVDFGGIHACTSYLLTVV